MIGLDRVTTWYAESVVEESARAGRGTGTVERTGVGELAPRLARGEVTLLDVRSRSEFVAGHLPGALHIPVGHLGARLAEIPRDKPIVVQCETGSRSAIAVSVLQRLGVPNAANLAGGIVAWQEGGHPVVAEPESAVV
jgi:hydroxyacylglutathione hydrolase